MSVGHLHCFSCRGKDWDKQQGPRCSFSFQTRFTVYLGQEAQVALRACLPDFFLGSAVEEEAQWTGLSGFYS